MSESEFESGAVPGFEALQPLLEEIGAAIAESQTALLAGKVCDLEASTRRQQQLHQRCELLRKLIATPAELSDPDRGQFSQPGAVAAARRVHIQNRVFAGLLKRMRRNLDALQRQIQAFELSYTYSREGDSVLRVNPANGGESGV